MNIKFKIKTNFIEINNNKSKLEPSRPIFKNC